VCAENVRPLRTPFLSSQLFFDLGETNGKNPY
jgi:hypothetical protein